MVTQHTIVKICTSHHLPILYIYINLSGAIGKRPWNFRNQLLIPCRQTDGRKDVNVLKEIFSHGLGVDSAKQVPDLNTTFLLKGVKEY